MLWLWLLACAGNLCLSHQVSFSGAQLLQVVPENQEQLNTLLHLQYSFQEGQDAEEDHANFWKFPHELNKAADLLVPERMLSNIKHKLSVAGISTTVLIDDVENVIHSQNLARKQVIKSQDRETTRDKRQANIEVGDGFYKAYQRYDKIMDRIDKLTAMYPELVTKITIGESVEKRKLVLLKLSKYTAQSKSTVWLDGGIHAREWISPAVVMFLLEKILENDSELDSTDFYVLPLVNPDGYEYSHTTNRLWRKNRAKNGFSNFCMGVDLNRNFDFKWMVSGSSRFICSDTYAGPSQLSEPETRAMHTYINNSVDKLDVYLTFHSYGQYWLRPWGYTIKKTNKDAKLVRLGQKVVKAIKSRHSTVFSNKQASLFGEASGASDDWAFNLDKVNYSYTVELRPATQKQGGFLLPDDQIIPSGEEMWEGLKTLIRNI